MHPQAQFISHLFITKQTPVTYIAIVPEMSFMSLQVIYSLLHKGNHNLFLGGVSSLLLFIVLSLKQISLNSRVWFCLLFRLYIYMPSHSMYSFVWILMLVLCLWDSFLLSHVAGKLFIFVVIKSPHLGKNY